MHLADKLQRLIDESGWSVAEVSRRLGRDPSGVAVLRWLRRTDTGRPVATGPQFKNDGSPRKRRESSAPDRRDILALADLFGIEIRWLIDDDLDWDDRLTADNPVLADIKRLSIQDQLAMLKWHVSQSRTNPEAANGNSPGGKPGLKRKN
jgi:hypothetical protein